MKFVACSNGMDTADRVSCESIAVNGDGQLDPGPLTDDAV